MLYNLTYHAPISHESLDLLGQRPLHIVVFLAGTGEVDVDARAHAGEHLGAQALPAQVDGCRVDLIEQDGGEGAEDLHFEFGALDDVDGGDERVDDQRAAGAVVQADGVGFADDADGRFGAAGDEDGV